MCLCSSALFPTFIISVNVVNKKTSAAEIKSRLLIFFNIFLKMTQFVNNQIIVLPCVPEFSSPTVILNFLWAERAQSAQT